MNLADCCDLYCTTCRICYLRVLRPGDTVPFKRPTYIFPLGVTEGMLAFVIVVLDSLAIFNQSQGLASPPPSFAGSPGIPIWVSVVTAIAFGSSTITTFIVVILLTIMTMSISEEIVFQKNHAESSGAVVSIILCFITAILLFVTSSSALHCYASLTSHDDRWFTDRGTQYDLVAPDSGQETSAKLSVPSGQAAFLFYAPSAEAERYSSVFSGVMKGLEKNKGENTEDYSEEVITDRIATDTNENVDTFVAAAPSSACRVKTIHDGYLNAAACD